MVLKEYKVSIVMAVYNVEQFLCEAVDSLISQDIGFENLQLILVDDGSSDRSGQICDEYSARYPDNVLTIHKPNGGVASARNEGLRYACGKYLNFMDSDDILLPNAFSEMFAFFEQHKEETDIVTIPLQFFDAASGEHWQNSKFAYGSRIIDLNEEPETTLMFVTASIFAARVKERIVFDPTLPCGEDIKVIYSILKDKQTIGVVDKSKYMYRRRGSGEASLIQSSRSRLSWYFDYFKNLQDALFEMYRDERGEVPRFIKCLFACEMQWRFQSANSNNLVKGGVLNDQQYLAYKNLLHHELEELDFDSLSKSKFLYQEEKLFQFRYKAQVPADLVWNACQGSLMMGVGNQMICVLSRSALKISIVEIRNKKLYISGIATLPVTGRSEEYNFMIYTNNRGRCVAWTDYEKDFCILDEPFMIHRSFTAEVSLEKCERIEIRFALEYAGYTSFLSSIRIAYTAPLSIAYPHMAYCRDGWMVSFTRGMFVVQAADAKEMHTWNKILIKELWRKRKDSAAQKALIIRLILPLLRGLTKRPIWLLADRYTSAGDNAEALFRYIQENKTADSPRVYFVINGEAQDYQRMKKYGPTVKAFSLKHKLLYLLCQANISSHADEFVLTPFYGHDEPYRNLYANKRLVFLQHGISEKDGSPWLHKNLKNLGLFFTATQMEYNAILKGTYGYTDDVVKLAGFPRFDLLQNCPKRQIVIMPTWRAALVTGFDRKTGLRNLKQGIEKSTFFKIYADLLSSTRLFDAAQQRGYQICFFDHPNMRVAGILPKDGRLVLLPNTMTYRNIFSQASLLVTDYSSVAFDFAYLRKPLVYFQADTAEFYAGQLYDKGYFSYEEDGFGEVLYSADTLIDTLLTYMEAGCVMKPEYRRRVDEFFTFNDKNNSRRVYEEIKKYAHFDA